MQSLPDCLQYIGILQHSRERAFHILKAAHNQQVHFSKNNKKNLHKVMCLSYASITVLSQHVKAAQLP